MKLKAQSTIEYLLMFAVIVLVLITFLRRGQTEQKFAAVYDKTGDKMSEMVGRSNSGEALTGNALYEQFACERVDVNVAGRCYDSANQNWQFVSGNRICTIRHGEPQADCQGSNFRICRGGNYWDELTGSCKHGRP